MLKVYRFLGIGLVAACTATMIPLVGDYVLSRRAEWLPWSATETVAAPFVVATILLAMTTVFCILRAAFEYKDVLDTVAYEKRYGPTEGAAGAAGKAARSWTHTHGTYWFRWFAFGTCLNFVGVGLAYLGLGLGVQIFCHASGAIVIYIGTQLRSERYALDCMLQSKGMK